MNIGERVRIKCNDGSGYLCGEVKGTRFGKVLVLLDEYNTIPYEFDKDRLEHIEDNAELTGRGPGV